MQNPVRLTHFWQSVVIIVIVMVALGLASTPIPLQAQDGGTQQVSAHHVLQVVNPEDPALNRICIGQPYHLRLRVALDNLEWRGNAEAGGVVLRSGQFTATIGDTSIVRVDPVGFTSENGAEVPFQTDVELVGVTPGTTTVTINAHLQGDVPLFYDPEVPLPFSFTDDAQPATESMASPMFMLNDVPIILTISAMGEGSTSVSITIMGNNPFRGAAPCS